MSGKYYKITNIYIVHIIFNHHSALLILLNEKMTGKENHWSEGTG